MQDDEYAGAKVVAVLPGSVCHLWLVSREDDQAWISDATCQAVHIETESLEKRELELKGRRYWILSEPHGSGWKASAVEVREDGSSEALGIEATAETRGAADDSAERKLRRLLQAY